VARAIEEMRDENGVALLAQVTRTLSQIEAREEQTSRPMEQNDRRALSRLCGRVIVDQDLLAAALIATG
jgi:hypothetical protein